MINAIMQGIFSIIIGLVNILLTPIDALISSALPDLSDGLDMVSQFFNWVSNVIPWSVSWFGLNTTVLNLFVGYITFELTAPLVISTIKLAIKWYDKLKV